LLGDVTIAIGGKEISGELFGRIAGLIAGRRVE
jgi:hypothetical protein